MLYFFDEQKERDILMTKDSDNPQTSHPKPGVTRAMQEDFFYRLKVYQKAHNTRYIGTAGQVDEYIHTMLDIFPDPVVKPFGVVELWNNFTGNYLRFNSKQHASAVNYINMLITKPSYWHLLEQDVQTLSDKNDAMIDAVKKLIAAAQDATYILSVYKCELQPGECYSTETYGEIGPENYLHRTVIDLDNAISDLKRMI